jgi:uncharacterized protein (TIGR02453 family)
MAAPRFTDDSLRFLRALKRNNRRDWFEAHRDDYEAHIREPMTAIISRLAEDFREFGPEFVANPKTSMYRIYRDVRFSANKAPYKTHVAATFPARGLPRHEGAGLYFHVAANEVWVGGGLYAPPAPQLHAVREHVAGHARRLRTLVESPAFRREVGPLEGERLTRVPRGFSKDHPAAEYLKFRQFLAGRDFEPAFALSPKFYAGLLGVFRNLVPLLRFLNEPLLRSQRMTP